MVFLKGKMAWKKLTGPNNLMAQDQIKKEALFNEVKGSLFEYLVAKELAIQSGNELEFQKSLDRNYLTVLSQQDRMVRQFYPEMLKFLAGASTKTAAAISEHLKSNPLSARLVGKFSNSSISSEILEADLLFETNEGAVPVSLKLNKKNAFVNTKSGGIKSFFQTYFPYLDQSIQKDFNQLVDLEFNRMALELHAHHDLEFPGDFVLWVRQGLSELPGELDEASRFILKRYYARIAEVMHSIFQRAIKSDPDLFIKYLPVLLGFSSQEILQVIYFHDFPENAAPEIHIHSFKDLKKELTLMKLSPFGNIASVEFKIGRWDFQVRVKPMNKFTTTAIKINCSVRVRKPSIS